jgi:hypothetical protein
VAESAKIHYAHINALPLDVRGNVQDTKRRLTLLIAKER